MIFVFAVYYVFQCWKIGPIETMFLSVCRRTWSLKSVSIIWWTSHLNIYNVGFLG